MQHLEALPNILRRAQTGQPLYFNELVFLARAAKLEEIQQVARMVRQHHTPSNTLTYAHGRARIAPASYARARTALSHTLEMLCWLRANTPDLALDFFSVSDVWALHQHTGMPTYDILQQLANHGQYLLRGDDGTMLAHALCNPPDYTDQQNLVADAWLRILREAQQVGLATTAAVLLGAAVAETAFVHWLQRIRLLHEYSQRTWGNGFISVVLLLPPPQTYLGSCELHRMALTRLYLNTVPHQQLRLATATSLQPHQIAGAVQGGVDDLGELSSSRQAVQAYLQQQGYRLQRRDVLYSMVPAEPDADNIPVSMHPGTMQSLMTLPTRTYAAHEPLN